MGIRIPILATTVNNDSNSIESLKAMIHGLFWVITLWRFKKVCGMLLDPSYFCLRPVDQFKDIESFAWRLHGYLVSPEFRKSWRIKFVSFSHRNNDRSDWSSAWCLTYIGCLCSLVEATGCVGREAALAYRKGGVSLIWLSRQLVEPSPKRKD